MQTKHSSSLMYTGSVAALGLISSLVLLPLAFGKESAADRDWSKCIFSENLKPNCGQQQDKAFNKCIKNASEDGELTETEYFACAYSIYG